jgi:hypothetical protein
MVEQEQVLVACQGGTAGNGGNSVFGSLTAIGGGGWRRNFEDLVLVPMVVLVEEQVEYKVLLEDLLLEHLDKDLLVDAR